MLSIPTCFADLLYLGKQQLTGVIVFGLCIDQPEKEPSKLLAGFRCASCQQVLQDIYLQGSTALLIPYSCFLWNATNTQHLMGSRVRQLIQGKTWVIFLDCWVGTCQISEGESGCHLWQRSTPRSWLIDSIHGLLSRGCTIRHAFLGTDRPAFPPACLTPPDLSLLLSLTSVWQIHLLLLCSPAGWSAVSDGTGWALQCTENLNVQQGNFEVTAAYTWYGLKLGNFSQKGKYSFMRPRATPLPNPKTGFQAFGALQLTEKAATRMCLLVCFNVKQCSPPSLVPGKGWTFFWMKT